MAPCVLPLDPEKRGVVQPSRSQCRDVPQARPAGCSVPFLEAELRRGPTCVRPSIACGVLFLMLLPCPVALRAVRYTADQMSIILGPTVILVAVLTDRFPAVRTSEIVINRVHPSLQLARRRTSQAPCVGCLVLVCCTCVRKRFTAFLCNARQTRV